MSHLYLRRLADTEARILTIIYRNPSIHVSVIPLIPKLKYKCLKKSLENIKIKTMKNLISKCALILTRF